MANDTIAKGMAANALAIAKALASKAAPITISAPRISGNPYVGQTLTGVHGGYTSTPASYTYRWLSNGSVIAGATAQSYVVQAGDLGDLVTFEETPTNAIGVGTANPSAAVTIIIEVKAPDAPIITVASVGDGTITLNWVDGANNGSAITARYIAIGTTSGGQGALQPVTVSGGQVVLTGLANGTPQYIKAYTANAIGTSPASSEVSATPISVPAVKRSIAANRLIAAYVGNSKSTTIPTGIDTATSATYRVLRALPVNISCASGGTTTKRFHYANYGTSVSVGGNAVQEASAGPITVQLALEYLPTGWTNSAWPIASTNTQFITAIKGTSNDTYPLALAAGERGWIEVDVVNLPNLQYYCEQVYVTGEFGWPLGMTPGGSYYLLNSNNIGNRSGWSYGSPPTFCAYDITVETETVKPALLGIGHSQMQGQGNNPDNIAWIDFACGHNTTADNAGLGGVRQNPALRKVATGGERISWWLANSTRRMAEILSNPDFTRIVIMLGTNDLVAGFRADVVLADLEAMLSQLSVLNIPITLVACTVRTDTSNNPIIVSYTGSPATTFEEQRAAFNAGQVALVGRYNVDSVYDPNEAYGGFPGLESTTTPGTWADMQLTNDGIHLSGGIIGSTSGTSIGSTTRGGGNQYIGRHFRAYLSGALGMTTLGTYS